MKKHASKIAAIAAAGLVAATVVAIAPAAQAAESATGRVGSQVTARIVDDIFEVKTGSEYEFSIVITNSGQRAETVDVEQMFLAPERATVTDGGVLTAGANGLTGTVTVEAGQTVTLPVEVHVSDTLGNLDNDVRVTPADARSWLAWDTNVIVNR